MSHQPHEPQKPQSSSRMPGFFRLTLNQRQRHLIHSGFLNETELASLANTGGLPADHADAFIENCVGGFTIPVGIATNFVIDGEEILVPMAIEESSVVAAASHAAKLARRLGGFTTTSADPIATCQIEFFAPQWEKVYKRFAEIRADLVDIANATQPRLVARGGGVRAIELRQLASQHFVLHVHVDTREAMGANIVNTIAEAVGNRLPTLLDCEVGLRILTNLTTQRVTCATCRIHPDDLATPNLSGAEAAARIQRACEFAHKDPFRAATHNKGVMNGIDAVVMVTGNDWRAVEAGCHAYAAMSGQYRSLTHWAINSAGELEGRIEVPIAVGTVGGVTRLHPASVSALKLLGSPSSARLAGIIASVGLAQNFSAIRALASEGIQQGHMALHTKNISMMRRAGATARDEMFPNDTPPQKG